MRGPGGTWGLILAAALVCSPALLAHTKTEQEIAAQQARFKQETDPVRRAKMMERLGRDEFDEISRDVSEENFSEATKILDEYREEAGWCVTALDAKKINAVKHSSGFKELQISLQEALRRLDQIDAELAADQQSEFLAVRVDLQRMNDHLVQELFPSSPAPGAPSPPAAKSDR
ncbi:MAG TPA: hypothetical protein VMD77_14035 [Candidatus Baltobacteraceae bacterium]|nr:hypothetical protein [Candidatus Baltobacteraceae bacterium]